MYLPPPPIFFGIQFSYTTPYHIQRGDKMLQLSQIEMYLDWGVKLFRKLVNCKPLHEI